MQQTLRARNRRRKARRKKIKKERMMLLTRKIRTMKYKVHPSQSWRRRTRAKWKHPR
jgi:hypothetical protein